MSKPFHNTKLVARIRAATRRAHGHAQSIIVAGELSLNITAKTVTVSGNPVHLTGKEFALLELLALRKNNVLTKDVI